MRLFIATLLACTSCLLASPGLAAPTRDPLESARWEDMRKLYFPGQRVVFDDRVRVTAPVTAEDSMNVPVRVDASGLPGVRKVTVFADFNPILEILRFYPQGALASLGFRVKLQQSTPIRAAAQTADGVWHVGGTWVNTAGGGCTAPSTGSASPEWQSKLGEVSGRLWLPVAEAPEASAPAQAGKGGKPGQGNEPVRLRLRIIHPMDTGLAPGIPAFFVQDLKVTEAGGKELMRIEAFEPVSENPVFTLDLPPARAAGPIVVSGRDNNGNAINARIAP